MTPDSATTSTSAPQAPVTQAAAAGSAPPLTPVQIFWDVARLALGLLTRISGVLHPVQSRFPKQAWQVWHLCTEIPRLLLTIRFAPERITLTQLRHLTRARQILQALFGYTLPLGPRTPSSANATLSQTPSASANHATTHSPAIPEVHEVPEVPEVSSPNTPSAASSHTQSASPKTPSPALNNAPLPPDPSHFSHNSHTSQPPHTAFSPYIPDYQTLLQALKAATLPPNCAGALIDEPGDALVKALRQLHAIYFSLYPNQPTPPIPAQSLYTSEFVLSPSPSPSQSQSVPSANQQSTICNPQSGIPQSGNPQSYSVHPVHPVHPVHNVHLSHFHSHSPPP